MKGYVGPGNTITSPHPLILGCPNRTINLTIFYKGLLEDLIGLPPISGKYYPKIRIYRQNSRSRALRPPSNGEFGPLRGLRGPKSAKSGCFSAKLAKISTVRPSHIAHTMILHVKTPSTLLSRQYKPLATGLGLLAWLATGGFGVIAKFPGG